MDLRVWAVLLWMLGFAFISGALGTWLGNEVGLGVFGSACVGMSLAFMQYDAGRRE